MTLISIGRFLDCSISTYFDKKMRPSLFESSDCTWGGDRVARGEKIFKRIRSVSHFLNGPQRYRTSNAEKIPARCTYIIIGISLDILIHIVSPLKDSSAKGRSSTVYVTAAFMYLLEEHLTLLSLAYRNTFGILLTGGLNHQSSTICQRYYKKHPYG